MAVAGWDDGNETAVALFDGEVVDTPELLLQQQRKAQEERGDV
jgi:hypothetical protein